MPLLDHFHAPIYPARCWQSFHTAWATVLMERLNGTILPAGYYAEAPVQFGNQIEADLATLEERAALAAAVIPAVFPDDIEVQVFQTEGGARLVGVIELVSPANKDRPETRRAFVAKCAAYLQRGIGVVTVDIVTSRHANLHNAFMELLDQSAFMPDDALLYTVAYRAVHQSASGNQIELWTTTLSVGDTLPIMPLGLLRGPTVAVELDWTYSETRKRSRL